MKQRYVVIALVVFVVSMIVYGQWDMRTSVEVMHITGNCTEEVLYNGTMFFCEADGLTVSRLQVEE